MPHELQTDIDVATKLSEVGIKYTAHESSITEINNALKTASKNGTHSQGFPEYVAQSNNYILVIEDKKEPEKQGKYVDSSNESLLMDKSSIKDFAENGAVHYALHIVNNTSFKNVFAIGCSDVGEKLIIRPIYVTPTQVKLLPRIKDFSCFTTDKIKRYYNEVVLGNKPVEQVELEDILHRAGKLHEDLRNYGQLADTEKPLIVSGILLALRNKDFDTEELMGKQSDGFTDGEKIYKAIAAYMEEVQVQPQVKKERVLNQFSLIKDRPHLSQINFALGKTPLRYFAEYLHSNILNAISNNSPEDVLGRFYCEFISYSGGDGQNLGVVLTPKHITELFTDLVDLKPNDVVFDPTCGTGSFLVAALHKMLINSSTPQEREIIKREHLHGIELREDMFSIATTNMILRGDGKSNLLCQDFFTLTKAMAQKKKFTVGLMNPPYSQAKNKATAHLSELKFISHLLDVLQPGGRCAVIVPQSTMVGKSQEDKSDKRYIYEHNTLEGVITLNTNTFYNVGVNPVIAVFTAGIPHPSDKLVKFIDFKDDGYEVFPHLGLLPTNRVKERKKLLLDCWFQGKSAPNSFIVRSLVLPDDEWLHSFYYFNEEIPSEEDFEKTMADYLSFEFSMITHGRGYLFDNTKGDVK